MYWKSSSWLEDEYNAPIETAVSNNLYFCVTVIVC
jgi:hypothetical protein